MQRKVKQYKLQQENQVSWNRALPGRLEQMTSPWKGEVQDEGTLCACTCVCLHMRVGVTAVYPDTGKGLDWLCWRASVAEKRRTGMHLNCHVHTASHLVSAGLTQTTGGLTVDQVIPQLSF